MEKPDSIRREGIEHQFRNIAQHIRHVVQAKSDFGKMLLHGRVTRAIGNILRFRQIQSPQ